MRPALFFLAFLLFAVPSQAQAQNQPAPAAPTARFWHSVSSADGSYKVEMPGKPAERSLQVKGANGLPVVSVLQEVVLDGGNTYFGMISTNLVLLPKDAADAEKTLIQVRDNTAKAAKGTLITTRPAKYGSFVGLEYVVEAGPNATRSRYRSFVVGNRIVQQVYSGATGSENSPDVRKFHESLKLAQ